MREVDAVVVGAGFGGIGAALRLAEGGARVLLAERTTYPGGCACTFEFEGDHFEGGATLFSGFDDEQLFGRWIERYGIDVSFERLDPALELRTGSAVVRASRDRAALRAQFEAMAGAPVKGLRRFFRLQERVAAALWPVLDDEDLLPPLTPRRVARHLLRLPRYAPLARLVGRPLWAVLGRFGLQGFTPFVSWLDSQCQITVQCGVREAEAPFALAALDYHHRGAVHVRGGIGELAWGLVDAFQALGGDVRFGATVREARREADGWTVRVGTERFRARHLVCNTLPQDAARIAGVEHAGLDRLARRVRRGWSAGMLYRTVEPPAGIDPGPRHLELVADETAPFVEGNHVFLSIGAAGEGVQHPHLRRVTVSTHMDPSRIAAADAEGQRAYVEEVQAAMRATIALRAPEWDAVVREFTGSPRTFKRWTGRERGLVGGIPRRAGLGQYAEVFGRSLPEGLWLVGDSVFPGQSTVAVAAGGTRVALQVLARLGLGGRALRRVAASQPAITELARREVS